MSESIKRLIGIGASAGGLGAIQLLFDKVPEDTGSTYVIIQHLSPNYKSLMPELLSKHTKMQIFTAEDNQELKPDSIYLNQSRKNLHVKGNRLFLLEKGAKPNVNLPIDIFFHTLGEEWREKSIGVILSGTGSDGSRGIKSIKESGGLIFVQRPETAQFDGMPNASIATGQSDFIMDPMEMGSAISEYPQKSLESILSNQTEEQIFHLILKELYKLKGLDFSLYKRNTLMRRMEKRMHLSHTDTLRDYYDVFNESVEEQEALFHDFLIGVTSFFRDPDAFNVLKTRVFPKLCKDKDPSTILRIWVPGCSTGEEAYSIAIALDRFILKEKLSLNFKIFATDVHEGALLKAGLGTFNADVVNEMDDEYLEKYFIKNGDQIQIIKRIRDKITFSLNNVINDPPFIKIDMITCRNLLIYLNNDTQEMIIQNFLFSLNKNGFLFLGQSESLGQHEEAFNCEDSKFKIFRSKYKPNKLKGRLRLGNLESQPMAFNTYAKGQNEQPTEVSYYKYVSEKFGPSLIFIDEDFDIQFTKGLDSSKLKPKDGLFNSNITQLVDQQLATIIRNGVRRVRSDGKPVRIEDASLDASGTKVFSLLISKAELSNEDKWIFLLEFDEEKELEQPQKIANVELSDIASQRIEDLEYELKLKNDELKNLIEQLETSNEELQSSNEELMASNEELQSTNEELQSVNEELYTVNAELQEKNDELQGIYNDLNHLYDAQDIATLFLDQEQRIRSFTPALKEHLRLKETDIGRYVSDFMFFDLPTRELFLKESAACLETGEEYKEPVVLNERNYLLKISPLEKNGSIEGVVVTLVNVDELVTAKSNYQNLFNSLNSFFANLKLIRNKKGNPIDLEFLVANDEFLTFLGIELDQLVGKRMSEAFPEFKEDDNWFDLFVSVIEKGEPLQFTKYAKGLKAHIKCSLFLTGTDEIGINFINVTSEVEAEIEMKRANTQLNLNLNLEKIAHWEWDAVQDKIINYNKYWKDLFETEPEKWMIQLQAIIHEGDLPRVLSDIAEHLEGETTYFQHEYQIFSSDRTRLKWIKSTGQVTERGDNGSPLKVVGSSRDITDEKEAENRIKEANEKIKRAKESYESLFENINALYEHFQVVLDDEGKPKDLIFLNINARAADFYKQKKEALLGLSLSATANIEQKEFEAYLVESYEVAKSKKPISSFSHTANTGHYWLSEIFSPNEMEVIYVSIDITAQKKIEKQFETAKNEAILANRQKDLFLANMSHEIRTPMNGVLGFSKLLKKNNISENDRRRYIDQIEENSNQLMTIINDVLSITKIDSGQFNINTDSVDLDDLLGKLVENHQEQLREKEDKNDLQVAFNPNKNQDDPLIVKTDPVRLAQMVNNLVTNAIKFSKKGTIEVGYQLDDRKNTIQLWVKDQGIGIKKDKQKAIFDRFSQAEEKLSSQTGGIGLGLAITKSLTEALGGTISLESTYRKGSMFTIELPFIQGKLGPKGKSKKVEKVIVADDSQSIQFYYLSLFKDYKVTLLQAYNGQEALDLLREHNDTDLILLDMRMPDMDGPTTFKELRKFNTEVKVVAQSAFALEEQIEKFKDIGFDDYLTKPIEEERILELIS